MRSYPIALTLLLVVSSTGSARAEQLLPGLTYEVSSGYHVVVADVAQFELRANHPKPAAGADFATVEDHANEEGAVVAINANYFDQAKGGTCGTARGFAADFTRTYKEDPCSTTLGWSQSAAAIFEGFGHEEDPTFHPEFTEMVTGGGVLLWAGGTPTWHEVSMPTGRAMTALGVTADRSQFVFLVTDKGTSNVSKMKAAFTAVGVTDAVFLDGGGSTRLWIEGRGYVNTAEGADRKVPVAVVVIPKPPAPDASTDVAVVDAQPDSAPDADASGLDTGSHPESAAETGGDALLDSAHSSDADAGTKPAFGDDSSEDAGCSCRTAGRATAPLGQLLAALLLVLYCRRRVTRRFYQ